MEFDEYQRQAHLSDQSPGNDPEHRVIPVLGLVAESGSLANVYKKWLRDGISFEKQRDFARVELGDVLWYLSNIAGRFDLSLDEIAVHNLSRARSNYGHEGTRWDDPGATTVFDDDLPLAEQFPRKMVFHFEEGRDHDGAAKSVMSLVSAEPNPFPQGRDFTTTPKGVGFTVGDPLRDNAATEDGYRYHDALHLAFLGVLGWSPVFRSLLRLKRKSRPDLDDTQDSARAIDVEEGLATQLAERAPDYEDFQDERFVDSDTIALISEHVRSYEVAVRPGWLWKRAVHQGFVCWRQLRTNRGGYVLVDLDAHSVTYHRFAPGS